VHSPSRIEEETKLQAIEKSAAEPKESKFRVNKEQTKSERRKAVEAEVEADIKAV
jgi:hypothetical protein